VQGAEYALSLASISWRLRGRSTHACCVFGMRYARVNCFDGQQNRSLSVLLCACEISGGSHVIWLVCYV
jgi:hypothetical protein